MTGKLYVFLTRRTKHKTEIEGNDSIKASKGHYEIARRCSPRNNWKIMPLICYPKNTKKLAEHFQISEHLMVSLFSSWNMTLFSKFGNFRDLATGYSAYALATICSKIAESIFQNTGWQLETPAVNAKRIRTAAANEAFTAPGGSFWYTRGCNWQTPIYGPPSGFVTLL
jgi:hypothetical protein